MLSGDKKLNLEAENPTKYPKGKPQRKTSQAATCEICNKTIRTRHEKTVMYYGKNETHLLCSNSYNIKIADSRTPAIWTCKCYY